jgi:hypothetical protein
MIEESKRRENKKLNFEERYQTEQIIPENR